MRNESAAARKRPKKITITILISKLDFTLHAQSLTLCRMSILICFNTCPSHECAESIASALVEEHLAACVNIVPGLTSIYRWQGRIARDAEWLLIIKTRSEKLDALRTRLVELHPYELPELVAVQAADGLPAYLDWVRAETP